MELPASLSCLPVCFDTHAPHSLKLQSARPLARSTDPRRHQHGSLSTPRILYPSASRADTPILLSKLKLVVTSSRKLSMIQPIPTELAGTFPWTSAGPYASVCHSTFHFGVIECESGSRSVVSNSATPWTVAHQAPLSMKFSRQEYWSGLLFHSPGYLPDPGIKPWPLALQADSLPSEPPRKPHLGL